MSKTTILDFKKGDGLLPAVIQDAELGTVLMLGFMNEEALAATRAKNQVVFFSRTKNRLWTKGETSGHFLDVVSIHEDCDHDTLLIKARPRGPVCHTGAATCFGGTDSGGASYVESHILEKLERVIFDRKANPSAKSYTSQLFADGAKRIAQKVGEEGVEVAIAAQYDDKVRVRDEAADLLFHLLVLLAEKEIPLRDVYSELVLRHSQPSKSPK